MQFITVGVGEEEKEEITFLAENAEKAKEFADRIFSHAREILLYQLLGRDEEPVWNQKVGTIWLKLIPGEWLPLSEVPDETNEGLPIEYSISLS